MKRLAAALLLFLVTAPTRAALKPEEIGIIGMAQDEDSRRVAEHYAQARGIPPAQVLLLRGPTVDEVRREVWDTQIRPAIRKWLAQPALQDRIRCLVTTMGVPLTIGRRESSDPVMIARGRFLAQARPEHVKECDAVLKTLDGVGANEPPVERPALRPDIPTVELSRILESALKAAQQRIDLLPEEKRRAASMTVERAFLTSGGLLAWVRTWAARNRNVLPPETRQQIEFSRGNLQGLQAGLEGLGFVVDSVGRDAQILVLKHRAVGLVGTLEWIDGELDLIKRNETYAAFDSELSLILFDDYPLFRWQPNLLHYRYDQFGPKRPTIMVSRLAAPGVERALKLVDTAISVEKQGLSGKVYLDARGMEYNPQHDWYGSGTYGEYDQSLRDLAERLQRHTQLAVVLDNRPELFTPNACPDAALYCGWYSLGAYVDAFKWVPGAVGYHMASMEAETLTAHASSRWCPAMLQRGVIATLGPVYEPYLQAFPLPDDFFPLLLTGRYTLVETYYRTNPYNSWNMALVGDPLYNPFKAHPQLSLDDLPERMRPKTPEAAPHPATPTLSKPAGPKPEEKPQP